MFDNLTWLKDRMLMDGLVFRLQLSMSDDWELGTDCIVFFKTRALVQQYETFFKSRPQFQPQNIFELGLWDGGSLAFWFETFKPRKHVGIDAMHKGNSEYFRRYIAERGLEDRLKAYWGVDQSDARKLKEIVAGEFDGPLDLVIDDASHVYKPTKNSFECLFPLLRPGGLYIIEDWAWEHWIEFSESGHPMAGLDGLSRLVAECVQATATSETLIKSVTIYRGFTVVERGDTVFGQSGFRLEDYIYKRKTLRWPKIAQSMRSSARKILLVFR